MNIWEECIKIAKKTAQKKEVPIAAILVENNKIIATARNNREKKHDILGHAEIIAIKKASKRLKTWKLDNCELYVTLKPCSMCEAIIKQSRIKKVHFLLEKTREKIEYNKTIFEKTIDNDYEDQYKEILSNFFKKKRHKD